MFLQLRLNTDFYPAAITGNNWHLLEQSGCLYWICTAGIFFFFLFFFKLLIIILPSQEPLNDANISGIGPDIEVTIRNFLSIP